MTYHYETIMQVRDYECDIQGIVNNANYLHYTEHTRHLFLQHCGISFSEMHKKGEDFVVARMNLQYKISLCPDDEFRSCVRLKKRDCVTSSFTTSTACAQTTRAYRRMTRSVSADRWMLSA